MDTDARLSSSLPTPLPQVSLLSYLNALPALWFFNESSTACSFLSPHHVVSPLLPLLAPLFLLVSLDPTLLLSPQLPRLAACFFKYSSLSLGLASTTATTLDFYNPMHSDFPSSHIIHPGKVLFSHFHPFVFQ